MNQPTTLGVRPWLPRFLARWHWWTEPVRAERLAALRIGVAAILLLDILFAYLPHVRDFYGPNSLGSPQVFWNDQPGSSWSLLGHVESQRGFCLALAVWAGAAALLLVGLFSRASAASAWGLSQSFLALNPNIHNAGDTVRTMILFYLMLTPCAAAWSLDCWRKQSGKPAFVYPWALRLLFVQMTVIYFYNGVHKLMGPQWRAGTSLYYVMGDLTLTRLSAADLPVPFALTQILTWTVMVWEVAFPVLVLLPSTRKMALVVGVLFHVGIGLSLELGAFAPYMLCLYLPLLPWEFFRARRRADLPEPAA